MNPRPRVTVLGLMFAAALSVGACRRATAQGVTDDAALAAVCAAGRQGDVRVNLEMPAGVVAPSAAPMPAGWRRPSSVRFSVGAPTRRGRRLVLRGVLENTSTAPQTVFLSEAGAGYFHATLTGEGLRRRVIPEPPLPPGVSAPPTLFPEAHGFVLAPGARWTHAVEVELGCWSLEGQASVNVHWWFHLAGEASQGDLSARVDPR